MTEEQGIELARLSRECTQAEEDLELAKINVLDAEADYAYAKLQFDMFYRSMNAD